MVNKLRGTVNWFDDKKGYGFIIGEDNNSYFVHFTGIIGSKRERKTLCKDQSVLFFPGENERGFIAKGVEPGEVE